MSKHKIVQEVAEQSGWSLDRYVSEVVRRKDPTTGKLGRPEGVTYYHFSRGVLYGCLALVEGIPHRAFRQAVEVEIASLTKDAQSRAEWVQT